MRLSHKKKKKKLHYKIEGNSVKDDPPNVNVLQKLSSKKVTVNHFVYLVALWQKKQFPHKLDSSPGMTTYSNNNLQYPIRQ